MSSAGFDYTFANNVPAPAARWAGFPRYNFVGGHNDADLVPSEGLAEAAAAVLAREAPILATYGVGHGALGYLGLREFIARKSAAHRGIAATAEDVLITAGSGQGIDLVNALLVEPGDTVIVEEFSFAGALSRLRKLGANIVGAPMDEHGLRIDALEAVLRDLAARGVRAKYIYTIPTIQNPTGSVLPLARRHALLGLARQYGVPVFEDESLRRPGVGGQRAAGAVCARSDDRGAYRLVQQVAGAGVAAGLRHRAVGGAGADAGGARGRTGGARADGGGGIFLPPLR